MQKHGHWFGRGLLQPEVVDDVRRIVDDQPYGHDQVDDRDRVDLQTPEVDRANQVDVDHRDQHAREQDDGHAVEQQHADEHDRRDAQGEVQDHFVVDCAELVEEQVV